VRLVDLITNMDITTFTNFSGLSCLIARLDVSFKRLNFKEVESFVVFNRRELEGGKFQDLTPLDLLLLEILRGLFREL